MLQVTGNNESKDRCLSYNFLRNDQFCPKFSGNVIYGNKEVYLGILQKEKYGLGSKEVYFPD